MSSKKMLPLSRRCRDEFLKKLPLPHRYRDDFLKNLPLPRRRRHGHLWNEISRIVSRLEK
jgi:hypothetical protein